MFLWKSYKVSHDLEHVQYGIHTLKCRMTSKDQFVHGVCMETDDFDSCSTVIDSFHRIIGDILGGDSDRTERILRNIARYLKDEVDPRTSVNSINTGTLNGVLSGACEMTPLLESTLTRYRAVREIASVTGEDPENVAIRKNKHGVPQVSVNGKALPSSLSLSHHGNFTAIAFIPHTPK